MKDKKINLGLTNEYKKSCKQGAIFFSIPSIILLLVCIFVDLDVWGKIITYFFFFLSVIVTFYYLLSINIKVEIENGVITKTNCFKIKKIIGNLSDITSFSTFNDKAIVYKENYKKMFSFRYKISKTHKEFYQYLLDNHNTTIPIYRCKPICVFIYLAFLLCSIFIYAYLYLISPYLLILLIFIPISLLFLIYKLYKPCIIITDKELICNLFFKKLSISLNDITKIKLQIIRRFARTDRSSVNQTYKYYHFIVFNKSKKLLKVRNVAIDDINRIVDKVKPYNIKIYHGKPTYVL